MGEFADHIFPDRSDELQLSLGLRYRGSQPPEYKVPSLTCTTYSDETGLSAAIEYVNDGNGNETIPVFVTKAGNKVYIPPSIADLLRDKPPDHVSGGSECEYDEVERNMHGREESDSNDSEDVKIGIKMSRNTDEDVDSDEELGGIQVVSTHRKMSTCSLDFFDSPSFAMAWEQFKHVGPRLVPFLKTLGLYFVIFIPDDRPSLLAMMLKCLPIISLALFIVLHGIGLSDEHKFSRRILIGLIFSCLGDAFLIWPTYFLHGMAAFAVAQSFYIGAFGFQPMKWKLGLTVYAITSSNFVLILPTLLGDAPPMVTGVLIYSFLLTTMLWRAIARVEFSWTEFSWSKLSSCIGAIFFAISDTVLALNQFYTSIPYHQTIVMATYYIAQLGIALSVVTTKEQLPTDETEVKNLTAADDDNEHASNLSLRQRKNKVQI